MERSTPFQPAPKRWTALIGAALNLKLASRRRKLSDLEHWHKGTRRIQLGQLRSLLRAAAGTEIGREHGFAKLAAIDDGDSMLREYQGTVPIADYYAYRERLERMRNEGAADVLWPGVVRDWAQTSGTTAGDKFIPVSKQMLASNYRAALDIFAHAQRMGVSVPFLFAGKALFLGGSTEYTTNEHGINTGDLSGLVTPLIRWPISECYLPGREIALMSNWPEKIEAMARRCVDEDVRMVNGMPSWGHVLFERVIDLARERGRDARCLRDVWPNLTLFVHGGVKYAPFDARMREIWSGSTTGDDFPNRLELYPASEGFIALQDTAGDPGMRLLTDIGNFYEFVPLEHADEPDARALPVWEVEKGRRYVVVMTTCAGLWRYNIGDVVEFDTLCDGPGRAGDGPARLRIVGRHKHFINAFGENIIVEHIENAVAHAVQETGVTIGEFSAAPVYPREGVRAGLELALEIDTSVVSSDQLARFAEAFDAGIKRQNVDYTTKRTDGVGMAMPTITPVPIGTFHAWMESKGKLGGQHKCPRCANHREIVEEVAATAPRPSVA